MKFSSATYDEIQKKRVTEKKYIEYLYDKLPKTVGNFKNVFDMRRPELTMLYPERYDLLVKSRFYHDLSFCSSDEPNFRDVERALIAKGLDGYVPHFKRLITLYKDDFKADNAICRAATTPPAYILYKEIASDISNTKNKEEVDDILKTLSQQVTAFAIDGSFVLLLTIQNTEEVFRLKGLDKTKFKDKFSIVPVSYREPIKEIAEPIYNLYDELLYGRNGDDPLYITGGTEFELQTITKIWIEINKTAGEVVPLETNINKTLPMFSKMVLESKEKCNFTTRMADLNENLIKH